MYYITTTNWAKHYFVGFDIEGTPITTIKEEEATIFQDGKVAGFTENYINDFWQVRWACGYNMPLFSVEKIDFITNKD